MREAIVIGDRRKYLVALIGIELDTVGDWAGRRGVAFTTYADLSRRPRCASWSRAGSTRSTRSSPRSRRSSASRCIAKELDHEDGELTATQKVKRAAIEREFADVIEGLYAEGGRATA